MPGKMHGRTMIKSLPTCTESQLCDKPLGFQKGSCCGSYIFNYEELSGILVGEKELLITIMFLEESYDEFDFI